jgi:hypothetical protein
MFVVLWGMALRNKLVRMGNVHQRIQLLERKNLIKPRLRL